MLRSLRKAGQLLKGREMGAGEGNMMTDDDDDLMMND